jgi:hypothetical protein
VLFPRGALERLRSGHGPPGAGHTAGNGGGPRDVGRPEGEPVTEDLVCGMKGRPGHAVTLAGRRYWFCSAGTPGSSPSGPPPTLRCQPEPQWQ